MKIDGINGMDCKVYFTSVFIQIIDLYKKSENNLHETLINLKKVIYITHLNTHLIHTIHTIKKGHEAP
jgi:mevalonate pyrophosphate decarboxylase